MAVRASVCPRGAVTRFRVARTRTAARIPDKTRLFAAQQSNARGEGAMAERTKLQELR